MKLLQRIKGAVSGLLAGWSGRITEGAFPWGGNGADTVGAGADKFFRATRGHMDRDLPPHLVERQLIQAYWLFIVQPLAKRPIELTRDYVIGEGFRLKARDPRVGEWLQRHWTNPTNHWETRLEARTLELGLYGEWCQVAFLDDRTGEVRWTAIDPFAIAKVIPDTIDPEQPGWIELKGSIDHPFIGTAVTRPFEMGVDAEGNAVRTPVTKRTRLRVIHQDEMTGRMVGDCIFAATNKVGHATRGNSDLSAAIDWIDLHDQYLMAIHESARAQIAHLWDVSVKNGTEADFERLRAQGFGGDIGSGKVRFHNDAVTVQALAPQLNSGDLGEHASILKRHIAVGIGCPEHWLSEGGEGQSDLAEMASAPIKRLRSRQRHVRQILRTHLDFALDVAIAANRLPADVDRTYAITSPPIYPIDAQRISAAMQTTAQACKLYMEQGLVDKNQAREICLFVAGMLGVDAEVLDRETESPPTVQARDVGDPNAPPPAPPPQPDQLAQRQMAGTPTPALGGMNTTTLQGMV